MSRRLALALAAFLPLIAYAEEPSKATVLNFDADEAGKAPAGFTAALGGPGEPGVWVVQEDEGAVSKPKVLVQTSTDATGPRYPMLVWDKLSARDVTVSVRFNAQKGKVDRAGGIVLRYQDKDNYYMVRANALEDNVRLYRIVKGERKQFAGEGLTVKAKVWHTLKVTLKGKHFVVSYDDKVAFEADDDTFQDAGKVGLWTKADSVTQFDDLSIESHDAK